MISQRSIQEYNYLDLLSDVLDNGEQKGDRTGTGTLSCFGRQIRFDLSKGFPLLTTKKMFFKGVVHELLWFLSGSTNIKYLQDNGVHIWDEWADENGDLGPVYGKQFRNFGAQKVLINDEEYNLPGIDQLNNVVERIKTNPDCRRLIVTNWNPKEVNFVKLPPCHILFQFYVSNGKLSCQLYQRSADLFLGVPFNIASYALLTHMVAHVTGLQVGEFIHTFGDVHIYNNHIEQVQEQLHRVPFCSPTILLTPSVQNIFDFTYNDISLLNYEYHPAIKAQVAI